MATVSRALTDQWSVALAGLVPVPARHRERVVSQVEALGILGCSQATLEGLVEGGLPVAGMDAVGEPLFDFYDIINVGLYSGSGVSLGELGGSVLMRFAAEPPDRWLGKRRWEITCEYRCQATGFPDGGWTIARPRPDVSDGSCDEWARSQAGGGSERGFLAAARGLLELQGVHRQVVAPAVRRVFWEWLNDIVVGQRLRFQWLPPSIRSEPELARGLGLIECVSASLMLETEVRALGFEARTRTGHVLGLVSVEHAWTEFRDDDGQWKFLDPILAVVAQRTGRAHPDFAEFCLGSIANRVVPWDCPAGEALAVHHCHGAPSHVVTKVAGAAAP